VVSGPLSGSPLSIHWTEVIVADPEAAAEADRDTVPDTAEPAAGLMMLTVGGVEVPVVCPRTVTVPLLIASSVTVTLLVLSDSVRMCSGSTVPTR